MRLHLEKLNVTANGLSSSRPTFKTNGQEDLQSSQCVEFKVITNSEEKLSEILMVQKRGLSNWTCHKCYVILKEKRLQKHLHKHHKNGLKFNNNPENLKDLCYKEPCTRTFLWTYEK